jgi:hypothetical protein
VCATPAPDASPCSRCGNFIDSAHYDLSMCFVHDIDGAPQAQVFRSRYHAVLLPELEDLLRRAGFTAVDRLVDQFFQPVLVATNPDQP